MRASWPLSEPRSPFCPPEEDPFLLLESTQKAIEGILRSHASWWASSSSSASRRHASSSSRRKHRAREELGEAVAQKFLKGVPEWLPMSSLVPNRDRSKKRGSRVGEPDFPENSVVVRMGRLRFELRTNRLKADG